MSPESWPKEMEPYFMPKLGGPTLLCNVIAIYLSPQIPVSSGCFQGQNQGPKRSKTVQKRRKTCQNGYKCTKMLKLPKNTRTRPKRPKRRNFVQAIPPGGSAARPPSPLRPPSQPRPRCAPRRLRLELRGCGYVAGEDRYMATPLLVSTSSPLQKA